MALALIVLYHELQLRFETTDAQVDVLQPHRIVRPSNSASMRTAARAHSTLTR